MQGEALRQVLVNRYYGNVRAAGRRESLTAFGNGPLSAGSAGKAGPGGRTRSARPSPALGTSIPDKSAPYSWNRDVFPHGFVCQLPK